LAKFAHIRSSFSYPVEWEREADSTNFERPLFTTNYDVIMSRWFQDFDDSFFEERTNSRALHVIVSALSIRSWRQSTLHAEELKVNSVGGLARFQWEPCNISVGALAFMQGKERFSAPVKVSRSIMRFSAGVRSLGAKPAHDFWRNIAISLIIICESKTVPTVINSWPEVKKDVSRAPREPAVCWQFA
jgi:hypothetical protein